MKIVNREHWDDECIWIVKEPVCEHCGNLEPYDPLFCDTNTTWCIDCADSNGDISNDDVKQAEKCSLEKKIGYYKKKHDEAVKRYNELN